MSVWQVVVIMGQIGGSVGPLPYDMAECELRAAEFNAEVQATIATGVDKNGNPLTEEGRSIRFECILQAERPKIEYKG